MTTLRRTYLLVSIFMVSLLAVAGGCAKATGMPRDRLGALPFPGFLTLYQAADPENLGEHRYERRPTIFGRDEARGILYTEHAGFLDLAHIHITIDTVRYCTQRIRGALERHEDSVKLTTIEGSVFHVTFHLPRSLAGPADRDRERAVIEELSIRMGQRIAYLMMTWHELITWFGYRSSPFIDETQSSFTYDDPMSHVVGLVVAGRVLRSRGSDGSFDQQITTALREELASLGVVSPAQTRQAVRMVDGIWWARGMPLKRQLDVGLADGVVRPWLVPMSGVEAQSERGFFVLPSLRYIDGRDFSSAYTVKINPRISVADRMRELLPSRPATFDAEQDVPELLRITRQQMQQRYAMDVDNPWPTRTAPHVAAAPPTLLLASELKVP